jgi:hypothetical protein
MFSTRRSRRDPLGHGRACLPDAVLHLMPEVPDQALHGPRGRVAQRADRVAAATRGDFRFFVVVFLWSFFRGRFFVVVFLWSLFCLVLVVSSDGGM